MGCAPVCAGPCGRFQKKSRGIILRKTEPLKGFCSQCRFQEQTASLPEDKDATVSVVTPRIAMTNLSIVLCMCR